MTTMSMTMTTPTSSGLPKIDSTRTANQTAMRICQRTRRRTTRTSTSMIATMTMMMTRTMTMSMTTTMIMKPTMTGHQTTSPRLETSRSDVAAASCPSCALRVPCRPAPRACPSVWHRPCCPVGCRAFSCSCRCFDCRRPSRRNRSSRAPSPRQGPRSRGRHRWAVCAGTETTRADPLRAQSRRHGRGSQRPQSRRQMREPRSSPTVAMLTTTSLCRQHCHHVRGTGARADSQHQTASVPLHWACAASTPWTAATG
jgi:hypothetical protein